MQLKGFYGQEKIKKVCQVSINVMFLTLEIKR